MPANAGTSEDVVGRERAETILRFELRRALFQWPTGIAWEAGEQGWRRADLRGCGFLRAEIGEEGLPVSMEVLTATGLPLEALTSITWTRDGEHSRPQEFDLVVDGRVILHERVNSISPRVRFLETYFTPPDRRGGESPSQPVTRGGLGIIGTKLLPRRGERELPLPADVEWRAAVARAGEMSKQEDERLKKLGLATDGIMRLRLDENGQPRALGLVLGSKINELPQGWRMVVARAAVTMEVSGPEAIAPALLGELRAAAREHLKARGLPPLAAVGPVFARLDRERPAEGPLQLLLPLLPD